MAKDSNKLKKLKAERKALKQELKLLEESMSPDDASNKLLDFMANKKDPFNDPNNDWIGGANKSGCCVIC